MATVESLQKRLDALEDQVAEMRARLSGEGCLGQPEPKTVDEVPALRLVEIKEFARDVQQHGMKVAREMHCM